MEDLLFTLCFALAVCFVVLWKRVTDLERQLRNGKSTQPAPVRTTMPPAETPPPLPVSIPAAEAQARPVTLAGSATAEVPLPDPWAGLREMGLLPPKELAGEYALGSWWAVRIGGAMAVVAVVFLGIWLNMRSTLPPLVRLVELLLVGGLGLWGGLRLEKSRADLGRVLFAAGLTVFQFAAWATYGLERMRVLDTPAEAAILQFGVAVAAGFVALARKDKLIAQLSLIFTAVAVVLSIKAGTEVLTLALEAASIAVLGAILLSRGGWASSAVLGLLGSLACLLILRGQRPPSAELAIAVQLGAGLTFIALWLADRLGRVESSFSERGRNTFLAAAFLLPALAATLASFGGEQGRAVAAALVAVVALAVGVVEYQRRRQAAEVLLSSVLLWAGAAGAWAVEPKLVWLVWMLAAASTQLIYSRLQGRLLPWLAEALALAALVAYIKQPPVEPWLRLMAPALAGGLVAWRLGFTAGDSVICQLRRVCSLLALGIFVCFGLSQFPLADQPWVWLLVVPFAFFFRQPNLLWALLPAFLWSHLTVLGQLLDRADAPVVWPLLWAGVLMLVNALAVWVLRAQKQPIALVGQAFLAIAAGVMALCAVRGALGHYPFAVQSPWELATFWAAGAVVTALWAEVLRRLAVAAWSSLALQFVLLPTFYLFAISGSSAAATLPTTLLWQGGFALALVSMARHSSTAGGLGTAFRTVFALGLGGALFAIFDELPGAGTSLFWAITAGLTFILGHWLTSRSYRMIGLVGLLVATINVVARDVHDVLGRIVACGAVAVAFLGVAWLYGKITKPHSTDA